MKILFTGTSSFTGYWFVKHLVEAGHDVVATYRGDRAGYDGLRARRVELASALCRSEFGCAFGSDAFMAVVDGGGFDVLCHHAAEVHDYKNPDFDYAAALAGNTHGIRRVLTALATAGCDKLVATGSVFEHDEGAGDAPLRAFSPYGLSKGLSWQVLRHFADEQGIALGKFVIPNPFGPFEEPRFTSYLIRMWSEGKTPVVGTPAYLRDNIHVSLLARAYADFVGQLSGGPTIERHGPCGYIETQGAFAQRFAAEMRPRLSMPCDVDLAVQTEFAEPRMRTNTDIVDAAQLGWDESAAWDELADYYRARLDGREP